MTHNRQKKAMGRGERNEKSTYWIDFGRDWPANRDREPRGIKKQSGRQKGHQNRTDVRGREFGFPSGGLEEVQIHLISNIGGVWANGRREN